MAGLTALLAASQGLQAGAGLAGSVMAARGQRAEGRYARAAYEVNARQAELAAQDALDRGEVEAASIRRQGKQVMGAQRAALAAQGITGETPAALMGETALSAGFDADQARSNAWREAWGFRQQAQDLRRQGKMTQQGLRNQAKSTLLTGGLAFARGLTEVGSTLSKIRTPKKTGLGAAGAAGSGGLGWYTGQ